MKFKVYPEVFEKLPNVCFAVVAAYGIDNRGEHKRIQELLMHSIEKVREEIGGTDIKKNRDIIPYRQAFLELGFNPNKYLSSIEAMVKRVAKGGDLRGALERAFDAGVPYLVNVLTDPADAYPRSSTLA